uniref:Uncharacterized protein n=1 Tax=Lepeophtheirus salmonis TaxID=72036 RepID=A0A0K2VFH9_LEPSM
MMAICRSLTHKTRWTQSPNQYQGQEQHFRAQNFQERTHTCIYNNLREYYLFYHQWTKLYVRLLHMGFRSRTQSL